MNTRLYRLTPAGGKPNHYTDSYASALAKLPPGNELLHELAVGDVYHVADGTWERVA